MTRSLKEAGADGRHLGPYGSGSGAAGVGGREADPDAGKDAGVRRQRGAFQADLDEVTIWFDDEACPSMRAGCTVEEPRDSWSTEDGAAHNWRYHYDARCATVLKGCKKALKAFEGWLAHCRAHDDEIRGRQLQPREREPLEAVNVEREQARASAGSCSSATAAASTAIPLPLRTRRPRPWQT